MQKQTLNKIRFSSNWSSKNKNTNKFCKVLSRNNLVLVWWTNSQIILSENCNKVRRSSINRKVYRNWITKFAQSSLIQSTNIAPFSLIKYSILKTSICVSLLSKAIKTWFKRRQVISFKFFWQILKNEHPKTSKLSRATCRVSNTSDLSSINSSTISYIKVVQLEQVSKKILK